VNRFQYVEKFIDSSPKSVTIDIPFNYFVVAFVRRIIEVGLESLFRTKEMFEEIILCSPANLASEGQRVVDFVDVALVRSEEGKLFMGFVEVRNYSIRSLYCLIVLLNIFRDIFDQQLKVMRIAGNEYRTFERFEDSYLFPQRLHGVASVDSETVDLRDVDFEF
jgi:hypothetical protein